MSDITREEILAYTEAQNKTAVALEKIVDRLSDAAIKQDKMLERIGGSMTSLENMGKNGCGNAAILKIVSEDMKFMKAFWGILTAVLAIAFIVVEAIHRFGGSR